MRTAVRRPYDYLMLHGWRPVDIDDRVTVENERHEGLWLHPKDQVSHGHAPPPMGHETDDAVELQLLNARVEILEAEGWEIEIASRLGDCSVHDEQGNVVAAYYGEVSKMRSAPKFLGPQRLKVSVPTALRHQNEKGWTALSEAPEIGAIWDRHQLLVVVWCPYCETWHKHGTLKRDAVVGDKLDYAGAVCTVKSPYRNVGYRPVIVRVVPESV